MDFDSIKPAKAALYYASVGFHIFPCYWIREDGKCSCGKLDCDREGKHPLSDLAPHGLHDASKDTATVTSWWSVYPRANIGIRTGRISRIWVLDLDEKEGCSGTESLYNLMSEHEQLPPTLSVITGGGGKHLYFQVPDGVEIPTKVNIFGQDYPGIDTRGEGGYVIAPPGNHKSGRKYVHEIDHDFNSGVKIMRAPVWLIDKVRAVSPKALSKLATGTTKIKSGTRNETLFRAGSHLRNVFELSEKGMYDVLMALNNDLCETPVGADEVMTITRQALKQTRHEVKMTDAIFRTDPDDPECDYIDPETGEKVTLPLTDVAHAQRVLRVSDTHLAYVNSLGGWLTYDGRVWKSTETGDQPVATEIQKLSEQFKYRADVLKTLSKEGGDYDKERFTRKSNEFYKTSLGLQQTKTVNAVVKSVQRLVSKAPDIFDADSRTIALANGVFRLDTGELVPHDSTQYNTRICSHVHFDPNAKAPNWERFITRICNRDVDLILFLQRMMGYLMSGFTTEQKFFFLYGAGRNGKSTFLNTLRHIITPYVATVPNSEIARNGAKSPIRHHLAKLKGARVAITQEIQEGLKLDEAIVKDLTGGEPITADFKGANAFEFVPQFKLVMYGNHQPSITGTDLGMWRRMLLVPFRASIDEKEKDPHLGGRLELEASGIFNWAFEGYQIWRDIGLNPPECVIEATSEYRIAEDAIGNWIQECCDVTDPNVETPFKDLVTSYTQWCENYGLKPKSGMAFAKDLVARGYAEKRYSTVRKRKGIKIIETAYKPVPMTPYKDD